MVKKRNSSIELLRIISILMVIISHYSVHNGVDNSLLPLGVNRILLEVFSLGNIGVMLFVMITGYFMSVNKNGLGISKLLILYLQVLFYSLGLYLLFIIFGYESFSFKSLIMYMFPFLFRRYWFVTTYIILYFLAPYINKLLDNLSKEDNVKLICVFVFFVSFLPTFTKLDFYGNELIQFIMFYIIGAYFKKYQDNVFSRSKKNNYIFFVICALMLISSVIVLDVLQVKFNISLVESTYFFSRYSFIALMFSISLFNIFVNKEEFYSKTINVISSCVFGIYLLSDHNIVRRFLWVDILKNNEFVNSNYFVLHFIISIFLVFIVCGFVEYVRKHTLEKFTLRYIKDIDDKFRSSFKRFIKIKSK